MPPKRRRTSHHYDSTLTSETMTSTPTLLIPSGTDRQGAHRATGASAFHTDTQIANRIIKLLERCYAVGRRQNEVYSDWLQFVDVLLDQEEPNIIALATTDAYAEDPREVTTLLERLRKTYPDRKGAKVQYLDYFLKAYAELRVSPEYGVMDVVGTAFMLFGHPSKWTGQFFTPASVALLMAQLSILDGAALVNERLKAAIEKSPMAPAAMLAGAALEGEVAHAWFIARVIPLAIEHYQPVTVCDPAVGSGIMLVSASIASLLSPMR